MNEKLDKESILSSFSSQTKELWSEVARQEIDGRDPNEKLSWTSADDLTFFPYYDADHVKSLAYLDSVRLPVAEKSFVGNRKWSNAPAITVHDEEKSNRKALQHLVSGADGVYFQLANTCNYEQLLQGIDWNYCTLFFSGKANVLTQLRSFLSNKETQIEFTGALFWESDPNSSDINFFAERLPSIKSIGIHVPQTNPVEQIADALTSAVQTIDRLQNEIAVPTLINAIAFSVPCDQTFFETIAKLKALRMLWFQVAYAFAVLDPQPLHIHAISDPWIKEAFQPHANMLKATTTTMAAIIGGADSIAVMPEDESNSTMSRIARNTATILREESHLNSVADPLAGSFSVDVMTDAIAQKAWKLFQSKVKK